MGQLWTAIWKSKVVPKIKNFAWKLVSKAIVVRDNLGRRGLQILECCPLCLCVETVDHLILDCDWAKVVWTELLGRSDIRGGCASVNQWLLQWLPRNQGARAGSDWK